MILKTNAQASRLPGDDHQVYEIWEDTQAVQPWLRSSAQFHWEGFVFDRPGKMQLDTRPMIYTEDCQTV